MTAPELLAAYAAGERNFVGADLSGADLSGSDLRGSDLRGSDLEGVIR
jgi:2-iminobutanoate/2-iminopropanoate deaminase